MQISKEFKGVSGIYCLLNTNNGKRYIGLTTDLYTRINKHRSNLKHNKHYNAHLQAAYNKGYEFTTVILEQCSIEDLDVLEVKYINDYQTLNPKFGYNLADGGGKGNGLKGENCYNYNSNIFTFYNEDGRVEEDKTCYYMIKTYNLDTKIYALIKGKRQSVNGWRVSIDKVWERRYNFYNIDGREDLGLTQVELCAKYNLDNGSVSRVVRGLSEHCQGWSLKKNNILKRSIRNNKYSVVKMDGSITINNKTIKELSVYLECTARSVQNLCKGKYKTLKGYILIDNNI